eukprot:gene6613-10118_t
MSALAFEYSFLKAGCHGIGRLDASDVCRVLSYLTTRHGLARLWRHTKLRVEENCHNAWCESASIAQERTVLLTENGQVLAISSGSSDLYDTIVEEANVFIPHTLSNITPEWITAMLQNPREQPQICEITRFRLYNDSLFSVPKQRLKCRIAGGERIAAARSNRFMFVKLGGLSAVRPFSTVLCGALLPQEAQRLFARACREAFAYREVLHGYSPQVAPTCFASSVAYEDKRSALLLQDLALWKTAPATGIATAPALAAAANLLATLHVRFWNAPDELRRYFAYPEQMAHAEATAACHAASSAFEVVLERLRCCPEALEILPSVGTAAFADDWHRLAAGAADVLRAFFAAGEQPLTLCHNNLSPAHVLFAPRDVSQPRCVLVDWTLAAPAPVGLDLAAFAAFCLPPPPPPAVFAPPAKEGEDQRKAEPDRVDEFLELYAAACAAAERPLAVAAAALRDVVRAALLPVLLLAVCRVDDYLSLPISHLLPSQQEAADNHAAVLLAQVARA